MLSAMLDADRKPEKQPTDPEQLAKLLEIELMQKRAAWQRGSARNRSFRALAFLFLVLVIAGAFAAYFYFVSSAPPTPENRPAPARSPTR